VNLSYSGSDSRDGLPSELTLWRRTSSGLQRAAGIDLVSPSWVVPHPTLPVLYVTQESDPGEVVVVDLLDDGRLGVRQRVASLGALPCHLTVDASATRLVASNYLDGVVACWSITADGGIADVRGVWHLEGSGPVPERQERAHAHAAYFLRDALLTVDLGSDALWLLAEDAAPRVALRLPPGFGPRHLAPLADGRAVLVGELSSELALIDLTSRDGTSTGRVLDVRPTTTRPADGQPSGVAVQDDVVVVATRGAGSFTRFRVVGERLVREQEVRLPGTQPRAIAIDGTRVVVSVQDAGLLATYPLDGPSTEPELAPAPAVSDFGALAAAAVGERGSRAALPVLLL